MWRRQQVASAAQCQVQCVHLQPCGAARGVCLPTALLHSHHTHTHAPCKCCCSPAACVCKQAHGACALGPCPSTPSVSTPRTTVALIRAAGNRFFCVTHQCYSYGRSWTPVVSHTLQPRTPQACMSAAGRKLCRAPQPRTPQPRTRILMFRLVMARTRVATCHTFSQVALLHAACSRVRAMSCICRLEDLCL